MANENEQLRGNVLLEWDFPEYEKHERGVLWYVFALGLGGGMLIWSLIDGNFLFALIILLIAIILATYHRSEPLDLPFRIHETGVTVGSRYFRFRELDRFWIVYEPPQVKRLYLVPKSGSLRQDISIPLKDIDPVQVRSLLVDYVTEELENDVEPNDDVLSRILKI